MDPQSFAEQVVLVTGAASGIGRELARTLLNLNAAVVLADKDSDALDQTMRDLEAGDSALGVLADVSNPAQVEHLAQEAFTWRGRLDGLVNCAGIYPVTPFFDTQPEEWERVLATNLTGPFLVTQAVARRMVAAGTAGSIVNISSTASRLARPGISHYGASKAGLNQLTAILAVELAPHDIRVNAVLPGVIGTDQVLRSVRESGEKSAEHQAKLAKIPAGRLGQPQEVVDLTLFLLSSRAGYCTGGLYPVDGGFTLGIPSYRQ